MLSKYFSVKTNTEGFEKNIVQIMKNASGKKVLIYGAGEGFLELNKRYQIVKNLDIVAIADRKFETCKTNIICGVKTIKPAEISSFDFDLIIVTNELASPIVNYLVADLCIQLDKIQTIFKEEIKDERINLNYLYKHKFDKTLPKLIKKMKNKKIVFYGAGVFLALIQKYFDISELNVLAIADKKYEIFCSEDTILGYKTCSPSEIVNLKPDYVIVATKMYIGIIEDLHYNVLNGTKIKIQPLLKKSLITLIKEIWNM